MIPGPGAGDVQKMPLRVVDFLKVGIVRDGFDALLQRHDFVVARHHRDRAELKPFR